MAREPKIIGAGATPDAKPAADRTAREIGTFDFGGAQFDLDGPEDRRILRFILSQALYGEATGVYCGKSLFAARSLAAANFYVRQAAQELGHLQLFADIFRTLGLEPERAHWVIRALSAHNNYYPLKAFIEHAIGEGMVLDVFKELLLQTLPDGDPRVPPIKKRLLVICAEEEEHVAWGEKETLWNLARRPWLRIPFLGLLELQMAMLPYLLRGIRARCADHPVLSQADRFAGHVRARVLRQGRRLGFVPERAPGRLHKAWAIVVGLALLGASKLARARSRVDKTYMEELGFDGRGTERTSL